MGSTTDKIKGAANKVAGATKQAVGRATGDREMEGEGTIQKGKGAAQQGMGEVKSAAKKAVGKAS